MKTATWPADVAEMLSQLTGESDVRQWAITEEAFSGLVNRLGTLQASIRSSREQSKAQGEGEGEVKRRYRVEGTEAVIQISGILLRSAPTWLRAWVDATGYDEIVAQIEEANADESIERIRLEIDSPGGVVPGIEEAAVAIR
ncbi:MAG: hypothetical protein ACYTAN_17030, partial [Planctomycetota bacterium]